MKDVLIINYKKIKNQVSSTVQKLKRKQIPAFRIYETKRLKINLIKP